MDPTTRMSPRSSANATRRTAGLALLLLLAPLPAAAAPPATTFRLPDPTPLDRGGFEPYRQRWDKPYRYTEAADRYYTAPRYPSELGVRLGGGGGWRSRDGGGWAAEAIASWRLVLTRGFSYWGLWPELGYTLGGWPGTRHELTAGLGLARGFNEEHQLAWVPRLVVELPAEGEPSLGVRHGLVLMVYDNVLGFEVAHTWLARDGGQHGVVGTAFFDLGLMLLRYLPGGSRNSR